MYKRKGEKEAGRAVSKFALSHCRKPPLGSLNISKRDLVFKNMIILFSIANINILKIFFQRLGEKNMKASKFSTTFGNSSCCRHKSLKTELKWKLLCRSCCWSCWTLCNVQAGRCSRQAARSVPCPGNTGCSCRGEAECSRQCYEFPPCISSVLLPPRAAHGLGEPGRSCFVFQKQPEQPLRESEPRSVWAVNSRLNFCLIPNHLFTAEEMPGLPG